MDTSLYAILNDSEVSVNAVANLILRWGIIFCLRKRNEANVIVISALTT